MNLFKKSFKEFKKNILRIVLVDLVFILVSFLFLVFARKKLESYLLRIQSFSSVVQSLSENSLELERTLSMIDSVLNRAIFLGILVVIVLFLLYCFFQSYSWRLIFSKRFSWRYFFSFSLVSLPFFVVVGLLIRNILKFLSGSFGFSLEDIGNLSDRFLILIIVVVVLGYFLVIFYASLREKFLEALRKSFVFGIKKFYYLVPLVLVFLIFLIVLFGILFSLFIALISGNLSLITLLVSIVIVIVLLGSIGYFKVLLSLVLE